MVSSHVKKILINIFPRRKRWWLDGLVDIDTVPDAREHGFESKCVQSYRSSSKKTGQTIVIT